MINAKNKIIGGWFGDQLNKFGEVAEDKIFNGLISSIGWVGNILLYVSMIIIAVGVYCMIFKYRKPLKLGLICFLISLILIVIGGSGT